VKPFNLPISIPNILTVSRILLIPLFVIFMLRDMTHLALMVFTYAAISDGLDGLLARYFNQRTVLGAYLDPLADKLLLISAFVLLATLKMIPVWLTVLVISRDVLIMLGFAIFAVIDVRVEAKPTIISKWNTVSQLLTVFLVLMEPTFSGAILVKRTLFWITGALTTLTGFHYVYVGLNILQEAPTQRNKK